LLVNEPTLLPVLMPLAPAATLLARFPQQAATVLAVHGIPEAIISGELQQMRDHRVAKTANRSVVGAALDHSSPEPTPRTSPSRSNNGRNPPCPRGVQRRT
jgi:hypothetical protein